MIPLVEIVGHHPGSNMPSKRKYGSKRTPRKRAFSNWRAGIKARRAYRRNYRLGNRPSRLINRAPQGYAFTREVLDRDNNYGAIQLYDNTFAASDHKVAILRLGFKMDDLAATNDFTALFQQYLVRSLTFKLTSFFDSQMPGFEAIAATGAPAPRYTMPMAPKIEMIVVPNDSNIAANADWQSLTYAQIEDQLAQLQRKQVTTLSRTKKFHVSNPRILKQVGLSTVPELAGLPGTQVQVQTALYKASWLPTTIAGTRVRHYGVTILFKRVDGSAFQDPSFWSTSPPTGPGIEEPYVPTPKLRLRVHANFSCRAVS